MLHFELRPIDSLGDGIACVAKLASGRRKSQEVKMNEAARKQRNATRLLELYPTFRARIAAVITEMEKAGWRPRIQDAWRSPADQKIAFETGHSKPLYGFHNVTSKTGQAQALAVDMLDDDSPLASRKTYLLQLAAAAQNAGLVSGIRWGLPAKLQAAIDAAISAQDWKAAVKIGWDPTHLEPTDVTVAQAKTGQRPA